jgi:hypothetical protein
MPTHQDETLQQRYARENHDYLKLCGSMTAEQVADLKLQLNNSLAREQALQQRLTAADERADVLEGLVGEVLDAVGREPLDLDAVLRLRARMRAALKPAEAPRNQCDGCQAGIPLIKGTHRMGREGGYPDFMGCSAKLYKPAEGGGDVARLALRPENQRITPARFKCLACGEYHEGSGNLPCPSMSPYSRIEQ